MRSLAKAFVNRRVTLRLMTVAALVAVQLALTLACVLALRQNQTLRERAAMFLSRAAPLVGRSVPPVTGLDWTGTRRVVEFSRDQPPTLVYVFSVHCPRSVANWTQVRTVQKLSPARLRIIYVDSIDPLGTLTKDYLQERGIADDMVFSTLDGESALAYQIRGTPQAELVDKNGHVIWSRLGEFRPVDLEELVAAIETQENGS